MEENKTSNASAPKMQVNENGTYQGIFLAPPNMEQRITDALNYMVEQGDTELGAALAEGKKTIKGCVRYIDNSMADLAREMKAKKLTYDDFTVHLIARYYMINPDCLDVQNVVNDVAKKKEEKKKSDKPKKEETKKKSNVVPLTKGIQSLFGEEDFQ